MKKKLWGGRFRKPTDPRVEAFSSSIAFDARLFRQDVRVGIAQAEALGRAGYLTRGEKSALVRALKKIGEEISAGRVSFAGHEDIHSLIIDRLIRKVGTLGKKLHAGRSRNDLVLADLRLYLKEKLAEAAAAVRTLQSSLVAKAEAEKDVVMPGYTHLQHAQPVLFAHHLLAYVEMLERDRGRLSDAAKRLDVLPLGSAALAGSGLGLDQDFLARRLGFASVAANSMDAVADRDFAAEILSALAILGMHLSRLAEEIVLWSTSEFGFVRLDESFSTGSSFLPQKMNPDPAELIRGKTGRLYGNLIALLTVLKGLPLSYNRDLQEDKEPLFDSLDTALMELSVMAPMVSSLSLNRAALARALRMDFSSAADLAEYLVGKGVPFGEAHRRVGELVSRCLSRGEDWAGMTLSSLREISPAFDARALKLLSPAASIRAKLSRGSTAPALVGREIKRWRKKLGSRRK
jgi:argininosuccinate lyase